MSVEYEGDSMNEILRLTRDNNRMLHAMRRGSFIMGLFKIALWIALIALPIWFYATYVAPVMESVVQSYQQMQTTSAQAQAQFAQMSESLGQLQSLFSWWPR